MYCLISVLYPGSPLHPYWAANISLRVIIYLISKVILTAHQAEFPEKSPDRVSQIAQRVENLKLRVLVQETCVLWGYVLCVYWTSYNNQVPKQVHEYQRNPLLHYMQRKMYIIVQYYPLSLFFTMLHQFQDMSYLQ